VRTPCWNNLSFKQISKISTSTLVLIPIGTIEAHGGHLPLSTDTLIPQFLCHQITRKLNSIIAPEINFGICDSMLKFTGTITVRPQTLTLLLIDYLDSIISHGFNTFYILNGHGGNEKVLSDIVKVYSTKVKIKSKDWYDLDFIEKLKLSDPSYMGDHADRLETEMVLHSRPDLVHLNEAVDDYFDWPDPDPDEYSQIMPQAVYGYPTQANSSTANIFFKKVTHMLINDINQFLDK
jgi:creatinine amidohydrolase